LPTNPNIKIGTENSIDAISAAPYGSSLVQNISYAYIKMLGTDGLKASTAHAILNANYLKEVLAEHFPILYANEKGRVAHECIVDFRQYKAIGIEVADVAKRLMDYGYHAPTVSFPVAGTLMIEPTESESKAEIDRFADALISIKREIDEIANGEADAVNNVLKNAPHTEQIVISDNWDRPYSREKAAYPLDWVREHKFFASVSRIDEAYGDRNLICTCEPIEAYM
jgi:glycine dehydrogenase